jgi:hypothetical protein
MKILELKKIIKEEILNILSENTNEYTKGTTWYFKNQYMTDSEKCVITDVEEWSNGDITKLTIKLLSNNNELVINKTQFKYLSKTEFELNGYDYAKKFREYISTIIHESMGEVPELISFINKHKDTDIVHFSFTEEVKDGRSSKFNTNHVLRLNGVHFAYKGTEINISNVKYINTENQQSDYNEYFVYNYSMKITRAK